MIPYRFCLMILMVFSLASQVQAALLECENVLDVKNSQEDALLERAMADIGRTGPIKQIIAGMDYRDGELKKFVNVAVPGSANLRQPFLASFRPITGVIYDQQDVIQTRAFNSATWEIFRGSDDPMRAAIPAITVLDQSNGDLSLDTSEGTVSTFSYWAIKGTKKALKRLYSSFASQGPERQALVDIVQNQDKAEIPYVTHFVAMNQSEALAHAQVLVSLPGGVPLHIESEWPGQFPPISGGRRGEVGRLFIFGPQEVSTTSTVEGYEHWHGLENEGDFVRVEFLRRIFAWSNHDAGLDNLSFQVNSAVLKVLARIGVDISHGHHYKVAKSYEGKNITEHIIVFEKEGMRQVETDLMKKSLSMQLTAFLSQPEIKADKMVLRWNRNEFDSVFASGLFGPNAADLELALDQTTMPTLMPKVLSVRDTSSGFFATPSINEVQQATVLELRFSRLIAEQFLRKL